MGKDLFKASMEATVHKAQTFIYPHNDWQLVKEMLDKSEVPLKPTWPLRTSCSNGLDNPERKVNSGPLHILQHSAGTFEKKTKRIGKNSTGNRYKSEGDVIEITNLNYIFFFTQRCYPDVRYQTLDSWATANRQVRQVRDCFNLPKLNDD